MHKQNMHIRLLCLAVLLLFATGCAGPKAFLDVTTKFSDAAVKATAVTQAKLADHENFLRKKYLAEVLLEGKDIERSRLRYAASSEKGQEVFYKSSDITPFQIEVLNKACSILQLYAKQLMTIAKGEHTAAVQTQAAAIKTSVLNSITILSERASDIDAGTKKEVLGQFKQVSDFSTLLASKLIEAQQEKLLREAIINAAPHVSKMIGILKEESKYLNQGTEKFYADMLREATERYPSKAPILERYKWFEVLDLIVINLNSAEKTIDSDDTVYSTFLKAHQELVAYANKKVSLEILMHSIETFSAFASTAFLLI